MKKFKKKILIITTNRAEFSILIPVIKRLKKLKINNELLVTGSHLMKNFGNTQSEIYNEGVKINYKLPVKLLKDDKISYCKFISKIFNSFSKIVEKVKPNAILVAGDRFELIPFSYTSLIFRIPIIHLCGGEITKGSADETNRHLISKMAHFHFVTNKSYRENLIQMGEKKKNIIVSGATSLDNIRNQDLIRKSILFRKLKIEKKSPTIVVTYHPNTTEPKKNLKEFKIIFNIIKKYKKINFVLTFPNFDIGHSEIIENIKKNKNLKNLKVFKSLGYLQYMSLVKASDIILGNSSSGIFEAPFVKTFTINTGDRQEGRLKSKSVFDIKFVTEKNISLTINKIFKIKNKKKYFQNLFGNGNAATKVSNFIKKNSLSFYKKKFNKINLN